MKVTRLNLRLKADPKRVILRSLNVGSEARFKRIIENVLEMSDQKTDNMISDVIKSFGHRHNDLENLLEKNFYKIENYIATDAEISRNKKLLLGAYFSMEYSIEAAALFNPSIVPYPDQTGVPEGSTKFVMSLRATGEGHISSIEFREGILSDNNEGKLIDTTGKSELPSIVNKSDGNEIINSDETLDEENYNISFDANGKLDERVIFPYSPSEIAGVEDVRFVEFDDDGTKHYYGTYTAYDGHKIMPKLVETEDFLNFRIRTMHGKVVQNKGMALFPRKINGQYAMITREDGESLFIAFSNDLHCWEESKLIRVPKEDWEYVQMGNCGSPVETDKGWILITHGVGSVRKYVIGALLLDLNDPSKVIGALNEPLISPNESEREGYVPNVVYSCGAMVHNNELVIPYAMSDSYTGFAKVNVNDLLNELLK